MHRPKFRVTACMVTIISIAIPVAALASATPAGAAGPYVNLIHESEFDNVPITGQFATLFPPGSHIGAWTVSGATVAVSSPFPGIVTGISGRNLQFLSLKDPTGSTSLGVGKVCQQVTLDSSRSYKLRFYSAAVTSAATLIVRWQGKAVGRFDQAGSLGDTNWTPHTISLGQANASAGKVCFTGSDEGFPIIDAIKLVATTS